MEANLGRRSGTPCERVAKRPAGGRGPRRGRRRRAAAIIAALALALLWPGVPGDARAQEAEDVSELEERRDAVLRAQRATRALGCGGSGVGAGSASAHDREHPGRR